MHIREGAANSIKLVVIYIHIHVRINNISQIILEDVPDERSKCGTLWASPGHLCHSLTTDASLTLL